MKYRITLKKLFIYLLFSMGMHLVLDALYHYEYVNFLFGVMTGCFWVFLISED